MTKLLNHPQVKPLLSDEHFSVDGTLIEAWASQKSFRPKDGSGDDDGGANFHGQKRKNDTHASTTDPDCRLYRKAAGREAKLCYMGHATMENRHGLAVAGMVTLATGTAERRASETMLKLNHQNNEWLFALAAQHHQAGQLIEAENLYRQVTVHAQLSAGGDVTFDLGGFHRSNFGRRQERVWRAQRLEAKIDAIAPSAVVRDRTPGI
jgi:hypothetical protein